MLTMPLALRDIYNVPLGTEPIRSYRPARRPSRRSATFTGEAHRAYRNSLVAQLHASACARGVDFDHFVQHSRLAAMLTA